MKCWRQQANKSLRRANHVKAQTGNDDFLDLDDVSDPWTSPADGYWAAWDYWSERKKVGIWSFLLALAPERRREIEEEDQVRRERLKWKMFIK
jgi:hypothetical protein